MDSKTTYFYYHHQQSLLILFDSVDKERRFNFLPDWILLLKNFFLGPSFDAGFLQKESLYDLLSF
jgi:hypothetical protein